MNCNNCGSSVGANDKKCPICGCETLIQGEEQNDFMSRTIGVEEMGALEAKMASKGKENASSSPNSVNPQMGQRPNPQMGQVPNPQMGQRPNPQMGQVPNPQMGQRPNPQMGQVPNPQMGQVPNPQMGQRPNPQMGQVPNPQMGQSSNPQMGQVPNPQMGQRPNPQMGQVPNPQMGQRPNPQMGQRPNPQMGQVPNPQMGQRPNPQMGQVPNPQMGQRPNPQMGQVPNPQMGQVPNPQMGQRPNTQQRSVFEATQKVEQKPDFFQPQAGARANAQQKNENIPSTPPSDTNNAPKSSRPDNAVAHNDGKNVSSEIPKQTKENKSSNNVGFGVKVATAILSFFLCLFLVVSLAVSGVISGTSASNLSEWVKETNYSELTLPDGSLILDMVYENLIVYFDMEEIYEAFEGSWFTKDKIDALVLKRENVEALINKSYIRDFVDDVVMEYREYALEGTMAEGATAERFTKVILDNQVDIATVLFLNHVLKDGQTNPVENALWEQVIHWMLDKTSFFDEEYVLEEVETFITEDMSIKSIDESYGDVVRKARPFISPTFLIVGWGMVVVLAVAILVLNRKRLFCIPPSVALIVAGMVLIAAKIVANFILSDLGSLVAELASLITNGLMLKGIIILAFGVVYIAGGIIRKNSNKKNKTE